MELKTVTVVHPHDRTKKMVINERDFDRNVHLLWEDHVKRAIRKEEAAEKKAVKKKADDKKKADEAKKKSDEEAAKKKADEESDKKKVDEVRKEYKR